MLHKRRTDKSGTFDGKHVIDPYHISEFNDVIMKIASLKDKDDQISRGIDKMTAKVCNTAIRLAREDHEMPLNRIDQAIAMNFARSEQIEHDINRIISEKLNLGQGTPDQLRDWSQEIGVVMQEIDVKTDRWLELSELMDK